MQKKVMASFFVFWLFFLVSGAQANENDFVIKYPEVKKIQKEFKKIVGSKIAPNENYLQLVLTDATNLISGLKLKDSQYFVYVDRHPEKQIILVCFFDTIAKTAILIGADKVSTGNPNKKGHFATPVGIFENTTAHPGYRALGTKNDKGWRGLGAKGSRVWDFGWQKTFKGNRAITIRLLIHATDPVFGEKRLGKIESKGCIRISGKLNRFLDHYGLLDKEYEEQKHLQKISRLLKVDREVVTYAGKYLLVRDS